MTFLWLFQLAVYVAVIVDQCGSVSLNCISTKPKDQETLSCTCTNPTNGIEWRKGTTGITSCSGATDNCFPATSGFTSDVSIDEFYMQISPYSHTDCATYSCKDANTGDEKSITVSIAAFDNSTITTTEPGAKTDGSISVTTDCIFSPSDLEIKWYKLQGSAQLDFVDPVLSNDRSTCTRTCNSLEDKKVTSGFIHTEYSGSNAVEVKFMVTVSHSSYSEQFTWTSDFYMIEGDCTCECKCKCKRIVIPSIVFGILGMINLPVVYGGTVTEHFGRTTALIVDFIGIVCDVISFVLGIVVQIIDCCKAADCCEDSDCCKDECESRNWIENTGAAFIAIGALVGIVAVAIFYLIWSNRMGPGNNGGNGFFCFNNGNDDGNDGRNDSGNNGHHRGRGTNSSTVHTERADTHRGTLSDRRPMPPIPLTDKKGRGLSVNYDDEHPMISVGIPDKKAGDLGPLEEESKKKKKKKKKTKNDGDEREKEENKE